MSIGNRVKIIRKYNKMNQKNFSSILGLSQAHISNIENDNDNPSDKLLKSICTNFNVNFEWLKNGIGEMDDSSPQADYNNTLLEVKKRFAENSDITNLELNEILKLTFDTIDRIENLDDKARYYNYYEKFLRLFIDSLNIVKEIETKNNCISVSDITNQKEAIETIGFEITRILDLLIS